MHLTLRGKGKKKNLDDSQKGADTGRWIEILFRRPMGCGLDDVHKAPWFETMNTNLQRSEQKKKSKRISLRAIVRRGIFGGKNYQMHLHPHIEGPEQGEQFGDLGVWEPENLT